MELRATGANGTMGGAGLGNLADTSD